MPRCRISSCTDTCSASCATVVGRSAFSSDRTVDAIPARVTASCLVDLYRSADRLPSSLAVTAHDRWHTSYDAALSFSGEPEVISAEFVADSFSRATFYNRYILSW